jgi:hypothetical protein
MSNGIHVTVVITSITKDTTSKRHIAHNSLIHPLISFVLSTKGELK